jgi:hypothetical protein
MSLLIFENMLIGAEGARLLRDYGAGETPQALSAEETPRNARGKRSAWSANQQASLSKPFRKVNYQLYFPQKAGRHS